MAGESSGNIPLQDDTQQPPAALVRGHAAQTIEHTASRRTGPRRWLQAVQWVLAAGHHPKTTDTTLRVAEDLAARMDYDTGHARYCLETTAARLGVDRSTVKRHVRYLREAGLLAWVCVGSRANVRRALGLPGYAATATVYAAVIPPVCDEAMGRTRIGTGYTARVVADQRGQQQPAKPVENQGAGPVDNTPGTILCAPFPDVVKRSGPVQVECGFENTPRKRARRQTASTSPNSTTKTASSGKGPARRSPLQVAADIRIARLVRPRVQWTQAEGLRRLAYALRPLIDAGRTADEIVIELHAWMLGWRPAKPAAYIRTRLAKQAVLDAAEQIVRAEGTALEAAAVPPNADFADALAAMRRPAPAPPADTDEGELIDLDSAPYEPTPAERAELWQIGNDDPDHVMAVLNTYGPKTANRIYGAGNVHRALNHAARTLDWSTA